MVELLKKRIHPIELPKLTVGVTEGSFMSVLLSNGHLAKTRRQIDLREVPLTLEAGKHNLQVPQATTVKNEYRVESTPVNT